MVQWIEWSQAKSVIEFGPGTGVFTEAALAAKNAETQFFAIEQSSELAAATAQRCPGVDIHHGSVVDVARLCEERSIQNVDAIICGLPWAAFPESLTDQIMEAMFRVLRPGGQFATFAYWQGVVLPAGMKFSRRLHQQFSSVQRSPTVWRNLPPAFVYRCIR